MYKYEYIIKPYETDIEYQQEFLNVFGIDNINKELESSINDIIDMVRDNDDWMLLFRKLNDSHPLADGADVTDLIIYMFSYTHLSNMHAALQEFKIFRTTYVLVNTIINLL
jgi:hypothetical protein